METKIIILFIIVIAFFYPTLYFFSAKYALPLFILGALFGIYVNLWVQITIFITSILFVYYLAKTGDRYTYMDLMFGIIVVFIGVFYSDIVYYVSHVSCFKIEFNYLPSRNWLIR